MISGDYYDSSMVSSFCANKLLNHPATTIVNLRCPTCQDILVTESCFRLHIKSCRGKFKCQNCSSWIVANHKKGEVLDTKIQQHSCWEKRCKRCFKVLASEEEFKMHCCELLPPTYQAYFSSLGLFDLETTEFDKNSHVHSGWFPTVMRDHFHQFFKILHLGPLLLNTLS